MVNKSRVQEGYVLPLVLVLMLVVGILSVAGLQDAGVQGRESAVHQVHSQAFELAETQLHELELKLLQDSRTITHAEEGVYVGQCNGGLGDPADAGFDGLAVFNNTADCSNQNWADWLDQNCPVDSALTLAAIQLPENWRACASIWQAALVGQDTAGGLEVHGGELAEMAPVWRYLITVLVEAPDQQGGSRIRLQSLLNAEEK